MALTDIEVGWRTQTSLETRPWAFDLTDELDITDVPASATAELTDLLTGTSFPAGLLGAPTTATTSPHVVQSVTALVPGHNYRLELTLNVGGSKRTSTVLKIACPY